MTKPSWITLLCLCLLMSACSTPSPTQPTLPPTVPTATCDLVLCYPPGRAPLTVNEDWRLALDDVEAALESCALQVRGCMEKQAKARD